MRHACSSSSMLYVCILGRQGEEGASLQEPGLWEHHVYWFFMFTFPRSSCLLQDFKLSSKFCKKSWASQFNGRHWAFLFWTCDDPAHTYLKLCTLWDDQQQLRVMEVQNMVDGGPGHRRQVHGGSLQAFKDITSARLPRTKSYTKSYVHGEASWSASVLSSSLGSDFRP